MRHDVGFTEHRRQGCAVTDLSHHVHFAREYS